MDGWSAVKPVSPSAATLSALRHVNDLTLDVVVAVLPKRELTGTLLAYLGRISRPDDGAAKALILLARIATAPWVEGDMRVELVGDPEGTIVDVLTEAGDVRERLFRRTVFHAPLREFGAAIERFPHLFHPLEVRPSGEDRIVLGHASLVSMAPAARVAIDASSVRATTRPPESRHAAPPAPAPPAMQTRSFEVEAVQRAAARLRQLG